MKISSRAVLAVFLSTSILCASVESDVDKLLEGAEAFNKSMGYSIDCSAWSDKSEEDVVKQAGLLIKAAETDTHGKKKEVGLWALKLLDTCASMFKDKVGEKFDAELKRGMEATAMPFKVAWTALALQLARDAKSLEIYLANFLKDPRVTDKTADARIVFTAVAARVDLAGARILWNRALKPDDSFVTIEALTAIADNRATARLIPSAEIAKALTGAKPAEGKRTFLIRALGAHEDEVTTKALVAYCLELLKSKPVRTDNTSLVMESCITELASRKVKDERFLEPLKRIEEDTASDVSFKSQLPKLGNLIGPKAIPTLLKYAKAEGGFDLRAAAEGLRDTGHRDPSLFEIFKTKLDGRRKGAPDQDTIELAALMVEVSGEPGKKLGTKIFFETTRAQIPEASLAKALADYGPVPGAGEHWVSLLLDEKVYHDGEKYAEFVAPLLGIDKISEMEKALATKDSKLRGLRDGLITGLSKLPQVDTEILEKYLGDPGKSWAGGVTPLVDLYEARRLQIPEAKRAEWDQRMNKFLEKRYATKDIDENAVCARVCELARNADQWLERNGDYSGPIAGMYLEQSWSYAILGLYGAFAAHAAPYCPKEKLDTQKILATWTARRGWYLRLWNYIRSMEETKDMEPFLKKAPPGNGYEDELKKQLELLKDNIDKESYDRALAFLAKTKGGMKTPQSGQNPAAFYGKAFQLLWYRKMLEQESLAPAERSVIEADSKALEVALTADLKAYERLSVSRWGSGVNTYAYSLGVLSLERGKEALAPLLATRKALKDPLAVPYDPGEAVAKIGSQFSTRRGAVARGVPFYAALSLLDDDAKRVAQSRIDLGSAQNQFQDNALLLALHSEREETHQRDDGLAPYYFDPGAMFHTGMLAERYDRTDVEPDAKAELEQQMKVMRKLLMKRSEGKAIDLSRMGKLTYPDSRNFQAPILGMSLLPLIQKCDGKEVPRSYGMLDFRLKPKKKAEVLPMPREVPKKPLVPAKSDDKAMH